MKEALKVGAIGILSTMLLGAVSFVFGIHVAVVSLEARVNEIEGSHGKLERQIDDIHWFLIKKPGVTVPNRAPKGK